jgi:large repetitive protein
MECEQMNLRRRTRSRTADRGFTLAELTIALVLSSLIIGVVVAALFTSQRVANSSTAQINASTDAGLISSFLYRDAQSAGGIDPATGKPNALGVSTTDMGGCTPTSPAPPIIRISWVEYTSPPHTMVAVYTFDPTPQVVIQGQLPTTQILSRQVCRDGVAGPSVVLSSHLSSIVPSCMPITTPVCTRPTTISLTVIGSGTQSAFSSVLTASLRSSALQLAISGPPTLPGGQINVAYPQTTLVTVGNTAGTGGVTSAWSATGLPPGLTINAVTGVVSGIPTSAGAFTPVATITVTDSVTLKVTTASKTFGSFAIGATLTTTFPVLPSPGQVSRAYTSNAGAVSGGTGPYTWTLASGALPAGVTINAATGVVSGTPTAAGSFAPVLRVTDAALVTATSAPYSIVINAVPAISTPATLPGGQVGVVYTSTIIIGTGGTTPYVWSITGQPAGITINSSSGAVTGTPTVAGTFSSVVVTLTDGVTATATRTYSITIAPAPLVISTATLPAGQMSVAYSTTLAATGGTLPYTWSATSGLPPGLLMSTAGVLSGTPTTAGTYASVLVRVTDAASVVTNKTFSITIAPAPLVISTATLPAGQLTVAYSTTLAATGGTLPYTWSVTSGLPAGLVMSTGGVLSGTPTSVGTYASVLVRVTDAASVVTNKTFSITIAPAPLVISTATLPAGQMSVAYSTTLAATGGTGAYTWTVTSGMPAGLAMSTAGVLSGTPATAGTYAAVIVRVTDAASVVTNKTFSITVSTRLVVSLPASLPSGQVAVAYASTTVTGTGGTTPYTWTATGLPAGLTMSTAGVISGTPTASGSFSSVVVTATDAGAFTATKTYSMAITSQLVITTADLPDGQVGVAYTSTTMTRIGGQSPFTWTATGLPGGVTMTTAGVLSGTPTTAGTFAPSIKVTDAVTNTTTIYSVTINAVVAISGPLLPDGQVGLPYTSTTMTRTGGAAPYTWSATGLPPGLTIGATTGVVSGAPSLVGTYSVTIKVTDALNTTAQVVDSVVIAAAAGGCPALQDSWTGQYYNNINLTGTPALVREDPFLTFNWGGSPGPGVNSDNFSVRWTRSADLAAGTYQIVLNREGGARLYVDGSIKIDKWVEQSYPGSPTTVNVALTQGSHTFVVEYFDRTGSSRVDLDATLPGNEVSAAPRSCGDKRYFGQNQITLGTSAQITSMSLTIKVAQTTGVTYSDHYVTVPAGRITEGRTTSGGFITYTFTLDAGDRIDPGLWTLAAQYAGNGTLHATTGDTWTLTTTTSTGTRTVSGGF